MSNIKKILAILLSVALLLTVTPMASVSAEETSGSCGENLTWRLEDDTLIISGEGEMADYNSWDDYTAPWVDLEFSKVVIQNGVTSIGLYAFFSCCTSLQSITIPDSVTSIGHDAFYGCTGLTSITIPDSVTSIGAEAFYYCTNLTSITIPDSVTSIGDQAFNNTGYYNDETNWENGVLYIGHHLIKAKHDITGAYTVKNGTKIILHYAFYYCTSLTSITIPDSVTSIGNGAFQGCTSLTNITIPDSVTDIGGEAFSRCTGLTSVTIPDSVTRIESYAFENCTSLTSITVPDNVTSIEDYAFKGCTSLTSITILDSVTSIGAWAFSGCDNLTIHGYTNSYAETYANEWGIPFASLGNPYTPGNVDGVGEVMASDALVTLKAAIGQVTLSSGQTAAADVNHDNKVDIIDALIILQYAAGKITFFPAA